MPTKEEALVEKIREIVREHYAGNSAPLLLSNLGQVLRQQNLWPIEGESSKNLRQFIESTGSPELLIVRDQSAPAFVAVTNLENKPVVEKLIERRHQATSTVPDLDALPRSVLLAFCVRAEPSQRVFLGQVPPFKYGIDLPIEADSKQYVEVEERYRRPGLKLQSLSDLSASDRLDLQTKIAAWSRDKNIPIESFYRREARNNSSALERLLAAQPPGLGSKIVIPGDIALLLSQRE